MNKHIFQPDGIARICKCTIFACQKLGVKKDSTQKLIDELVSIIAMEDLVVSGNYSEEEFAALDDHVVEAHFERYFEMINQILETLFEEERKALEDMSS
jgi:hypothetical protein